MSPVSADQILLQTKSFISRVNLLDPNQFADGTACRQGPMAALIDCAMLGGEDPQKGDVASANFRLQSELVGQATGSGNQLANWSLQPVSIKTGTEFYFVAKQGELAPALTANPGPSGSNAARVSFSYRMQGAPNAIGITLMNQVKPRQCSKIRYRIKGELRCRGGKVQVSYSVEASHFPSVRSWNSGPLVVDRPQGPFKSLWECDIGDHDLVR